MTFLLDVNVLIALIDFRHVHHRPAHDWFDREGRLAFATCPLTQNAVLRILGDRRIPGSPGTPAAVVPMLASLTMQPNHEFWPDEISLLDATRLKTERLLSSTQLTDIHLLALAVHRSGRFATFDRKISADAVVGGSSALHLLSG